MVHVFMNPGEKDTEIIDYIEKLPVEGRETNDTVKQYVSALKFRWERGTKIERLATLGWIERDAIKLFCSLIDNKDRIRAEYSEMEKKFGAPGDASVDDRNLGQFEEGMKIFRTKRSSPKK